MLPWSSHHHDLRRAAPTSLYAALLCIFCAPGAAMAASPPAGTLSQGNPSVTWTGAPIAGANLDESTCQEGVTCDTYTLRLAPGNYPNKRITVGITWLVPANDFDLYVHEGTVDGPIVTQSAGGAPSTTERASSSSLGKLPSVIFAPGPFSDQSCLAWRRGLFLMTALAALRITLVER